MSKRKADGYFMSHQKYAEPHQLLPVDTTENIERKFGHQKTVYMMVNKLEHCSLFPSDLVPEEKGLLKIATVCYYSDVFVQIPSREKLTTCLGSSHALKYTQNVVAPWLNYMVSRIGFALGHTDGLVTPKRNESLYYVFGRHPSRHYTRVVEPWITFICTYGDLQEQADINYLLRKLDILHRTPENYVRITLNSRRKYGTWGAKSLQEYVGECEGAYTTRLKEVRKLCSQGLLHDLALVTHRWYPDNVFNLWAGTTGKILLYREEERQLGREDRKAANRGWRVIYNDVQLRRMERCDSVNPPQIKVYVHGITISGKQVKIEVPLGLTNLLTKNDPCWKNAHQLVGYINKYYRLMYADEANWEKAVITAEMMGFAPIEEQASKSHALSRTPNDRNIKMHTLSLKRTQISVDVEEDEEEEEEEATQPYTSENTATGVDSAATQPSGGETTTTGGDTATGCPGDEQDDERGQQSSPHSPGSDHASPLRQQNSVSITPAPKGKTPQVSQET